MTFLDCEDMLHLKKLQLLIFYSKNHNSVGGTGRRANLLKAKPSETFRLQPGAVKEKLSVMGHVE